MADLENNPGGGAGELVADATPQPGGLQTECGTLLCIACITGAFMALCVLPVFFFRAHRTAGPGVQVLAGVLLALGFLGLAAAGCFCAVLVAEDCVYGILEGTYQRDEEAALPQG